jgi:hypothetical protein
VDDRITQAGVEGSHTLMKQVQKLSQFDGSMTVKSGYSQYLLIVVILFSLLAFQFFSLLL